MLLILSSVKPCLERLRVCCLANACAAKRARSSKPASAPRRNEDGEVDEWEDDEDAEDLAEVEEVDEASSFYIVHIDGLADASR